ncbi:hypothetical protein [Plesiomonas shigelloides]|nr:hypothetical protein [Plesiomonas shigelloides]QOH79192.1 hypothetical protein IHE26_12345 [Plesiomonas shigelloides]
MIDVLQHSGRIQTHATHDARDDAVNDDGVRAFLLDKEALHKEALYKED